MIELRLGAADLARIRFATSPLEETIGSLLVAADRRRLEVHRPWSEAVAPLVAELDLRMIRALVAKPEALPDFLFPLPSRGDVTFAEELAVVAATRPAAVRASIDELGAIAPVLRPLYDDPSRHLGTLCDQVSGYWAVAVEPVWPRLRALLASDIDYRARQLTRGGIAAVFDDLHPDVSFTDDGAGAGVLRVEKPVDVVRDLDGEGLMLVPSVFGWPKLSVLYHEDYPPAIGYAPRGIASVWSTPPATDSAPLAELLGRSRAALLARLDLPLSTTQLAGHLGMAAPTISHHLSVLRRCKLVDSRRAGREILYQRTTLGTSLLATG